MTEEQRAKIRAYRREWMRKWREAHRAEYREINRRYHRRIMNDPVRYAKYIEKNKKYRERNREKLRAYLKRWKSCHKKRMKRYSRIRIDRMRMQFRESPELYAEYRLKQRIYSAKRQRERLGVTSPYRPRPWMRIPDTCRFGRVLDTRSVFLWNNSPAASLMAGRAYKAMQWREIHCDRFGRVCR